MVKKKLVKVEENKQPHPESPAQIILNYTKELYGMKWEEVKSNYSSQQISDMYNKAVKKHREENKQNKLNKSID
ncbi:hypothetical protein [Halalkalibacter oceani]|uniref:hypothetical protein n=1 Tax=Halalkalibacter oceani TaxID=1653776 RepID=UPI0033949648